MTSPLHAESLTCRASKKNPKPGARAWGCLKSLVKVRLLRLDGQGVVGGWGGRPSRPNARHFDDRMPTDTLIYVKAAPALSR
jgi:hypothetical protein